MHGRVDARSLPAAGFAARRPGVGAKALASPRAATKEAWQGTTATHEVVDLVSEAGDLEESLPRLLPGRRRGGRARRRGLGLGEEQAPGPGQDEVTLGTVLALVVVGVVTFQRRDLAR